MYGCGTVREVEGGRRDARLEGCLVEALQGYLVETLHGAFGFLAIPSLLDLARPLAHSACR